jgi:hypothetical protein
LSIGCKNPFLNILFHSQVRVSKPQPGVLKKKLPKHKIVWSHRYHKSPKSFENLLWALMVKTCCWCGSWCSIHILIIYTNRCSIEKIWKRSFSFRINFAFFYPFFTKFYFFAWETLSSQIGRLWFLIYAPSGRKKY